VADFGELSRSLKPGDFAPLRVIFAARFLLYFGAIFGIRQKTHQEITFH